MSELPSIESMVAIATLISGLIAGLVRLSKRKPDAATAIASSAKDTVMISDAQRDHAVREKEKLEKRLVEMEDRFNKRMEVQETEIARLRDKINNDSEEYEKRLGRRDKELRHLRKRVRVLERKLEENDIPIPEVEPPNGNGSSK